MHMKIVNSILCKFVEALKIIDRPTDYAWVFEIFLPLGYTTERERKRERDGTELIIAPETYLSRVYTENGWRLYVRPREPINKTG